MPHQRPLISSLVLLAATIVPAASLAATANGNAALLERVGAADTNRDGAITRAEMLTFRAANFSRLDRNGDGVLKRSDIPAMAKRFNPNIDFDQLVKQFDANKDGAVSRAEFVEGPTAVFDLADVNKDGVLTTAERNAAVKAAKAR